MVEIDFERIGYRLRQGVERRFSFDLDIHVHPRLQGGAQNVGRRARRGERSDQA
jgi:hypothetical protein